MRGRVGGRGSQASRRGTWSWTSAPSSCPPGQKGSVTTGTWKLFQINLVKSFVFS